MAVRVGSGIDRGRRSLPAGAAVRRRARRRPFDLGLLGAVAAFVGAPPAFRVYAALSTLAGGIGSVGGGALAATRGFPVAFGAAGAVILASAALVASLRGISARTRTPSEPPSPTGDFASRIRSDTRSED